MEFSKKIDAKEIHKELMKYEKIRIKRKQQTKKKSDTEEKDTKVFIFPYNEAHNRKPLETRKALVQMDILQRRYMSFGYETHIIPSITIDYMKSIKKVDKSNVSQTLQVRKHLHQTYKNICKKRWNIHIHVPTDITYLLSEEMFLRQLEKQTEYLYKEWFIYNSYDVRYRSIESQTAINEQEVGHEEVEGNTYLIKFFIDTKKHTIIAKLDNPTHIFGTVAIAVHPLDKRYKKFIGKKVIIPIINKTIPIIADESVQMTQYHWAIALIPGHNREHLEIAKLHTEIPTTVFAIDAYGYFTEHAWQFAGKKATEFFENIVCFLTDISNLDETIPCKKTLSYNKNTHEELVTLASYQRFFSLPENHIYPDIPVDIYPLQAEKRRDTLHQRNEQCLSKQLPSIPKLPFVQNTTGKIFPLSQDYIQTNKKKKILTLCVCMGLKDWLISLPFTVKECIEALTYYDAHQGKPFRKIYADSLTTHVSTKEHEEFTTLIESIEKKPEDAKLYHTCMTVLEEQRWIQHKEKDIYTLDRKEIYDDASIYDPLHCYDNIWLAIQTTDFLLWKGPTHKDVYMYTTPDTESSTKLLYQYRCTKDLHTHMHFIKNETVHTKDGIPANFEKRYTADAIRLWIISHEENCTPDIEAFDTICKKIRNITRMIRNTYPSICKNIDKNMFVHTLEKIKTIPESHTRMILEVYQLIENAQYHMQKQESYIQKEEILDAFLYNFADIYVQEYIHENNKENGIIVVYIVQLLLQLLFPYTPGICHSLRKLCNFPWSIDAHIDTTLPIQIKKNYKFSLMMQIITQRRKKLSMLEYTPKWWKVTLYIQANRDFMSFIQEYEDLIKKYIPYDTIIYKGESESLPETCWQSTIININIGIEIQREEKQKTMDNEQEKLEKYIEEKKQIIQKYRSILQTIPNYDTKAKKIYEQQLEEHKAQCTEAEYKLQKHKYQKK